MLIVQSPPISSITKILLFLIPKIPARTFLHLNYEIKTKLVGVYIVKIAIDFLTIQTGATSNWLRQRSIEQSDRYIFPATIFWIRPLLSEYNLLFERKLWDNSVVFGVKFRTWPRVGKFYLKRQISKILNICGYRGSQKF